VEYGRFRRGSQAAPIATKAVTSENGVAVFDNVAANPAYVSAAYDLTGKWKATSRRPQVSSPRLTLRLDARQPVIPWYRVGAGLSPPMRANRIPAMIQLLSGVSLSMSEY
jgi:hypothetical protein